MLAILVDPASMQTTEDSSVVRLYNGETLLCRQVRLLERCGIRQFALAGAAVDLPPTHPGTALRPVADDAALRALLTGWEGGVLFVSRSLYFTQSIVERLLGSSIAALTVVCKQPRDRRSVQRARLDMRHVVSIAPGLGEVDCFPHFPLFRLDADGVALLLRLWTGEVTLAQALSALPAARKLEYLECQSQTDFLGEAAPAVPAEDDAELARYDAAAQPIFHGSGSLLRLPHLLADHAVRRPLVLCDAHYDNLPVADYLRQAGLAHSLAVLPQQPDDAALRQALAVYRREGCDGVVSVGAGSTIDAAKLVALYAGYGPEGDPPAPLPAAARVPHIAIPALPELGAESTRHAIVLRDGRPQSLSHGGLLPDAVILDPNLSGALARAARRQAAPKPPAAPKPAGDNRFWSMAEPPLLTAPPRIRYLTGLLQPCFARGSALPEDLLQAANLLGRALTLLDAPLPPADEEPAEHPPLAPRPRYRLPRGPVDPAAAGRLRQWLGLSGDCDVSAVFSALYLTLGLRKAPAEPAAPVPPKAPAADAAGGRLHRLTRRGARRGKRHLKQLLHLVPPLQRAAVSLLRRCRYLAARVLCVTDYRAVVFESFNGQSYSCNPRALYEAMLADSAYSDFTFVWAFRDPEAFQWLSRNRNTRLVRYNSLSYYLAHARAKYWITNTTLPGYLLPSREQRVIHTWHGKPIKRIGCDVDYTAASGVSGRDKKRIYTVMARRLTTLLSPSPAFTPIMSSAFNLKRLHKENILLESGYPRNDFLFRYTPEDVLRIKMRLGIPLHKKVILYAPTWRPNTYQRGVGYVFQQSIDFARLKRELGEDFVLLFRAHINEARSVNMRELADFVIDATRVEDVNELYVISDLMISDYSGTIFDYANLHRPMVFYMYDRKEYTQDQIGVYFDLDDLPGRIVTQQEELAPAILDQLAHAAYDEKYRRFNETYNTLDGPDCAARTLAAIIDLTAQPSRKSRLLTNVHTLRRNVRARVSGFFRCRGLYWSANSRALATYRNKYKGQRCFLIGNGPSLTMEDLNRLQGEVSFGCNLIYRIFDSTRWRPTFLCLSEQVLARTISDELTALGSGDVTLFLSSVAYRLMKQHPKHTLFVHSIKHDPYYVRGNIMDYYVPSFATVMTFMVELAMYMGFSEIYLLGVDATSGHSGEGHFINNYLNDKMLTLEYRKARRAMQGRPLSLEEFGEWMVDRSMFAYHQLRRYADAHGFRIFNATRGGMLEAFERADLDEVLARPRPGVPADAATQRTTDC